MSGDAAFVVATSVASAEITRVDYDYFTTGIGTGSGGWSVTVDVGGIPVEFTAPMAVPPVVQVDTLNGGEVSPGGAGFNGFANDATQNKPTGQWRRLRYVLDVLLIY